MAEVGADRAREILQSRLERATQTRQIIQALRVVGVRACQAVRWACSKASSLVIVVSMEGNRRYDVPDRDLRNGEAQ